MRIWVLFLSPIIFIFPIEYNLVLMLNAPMFFSSLKSSGIQFMNFIIISSLTRLRVAFTEIKIFY